MATAAPAEAFAHSTGSSSSSSSSCSGFFARFKPCRSTISFSTFSRKQWCASLSIARAFPAASIRPLCYAATEGSDPIPMVLIDQDSDMNATVVEVSFGDRLGALLDTMKALKDLGLDVLKGNVTTTSSVIKTKFSITKSDTGRKVENPELLEKVRLTILGNLLKYHPESSQSLAIGEAWGAKAAKKMDVDISTSIKIIDDGPKRSLLTIKTADKPGLLMDIIQIMNDINVNVESAEIDTQGLVAKDTFHVNYHGQALSKPLAEVLTNCLRYHLRRPVTDDESY